ncbi:hypothetical protein TUM17566_55230 [Klebsiella pneumoniae]|nr:hypothetical protein DN601_29745 [Klebsiella quasipneumoniae subsp. similipneumoniae]GJK27939.1 hypothetical protein TUM17555_56140 [Klebsiella pneumoniae]GJK83471.1 hypothetical protein TUM17566_55230 [Klebsiella pneumoniae]
MIGIFIVLSGFATTDLSVNFYDACQGGGAYGKTATPRPYLVPSGYQPCRLMLLYVSCDRSPQPNGRSVATE